MYVEMSSNVGGPHDDSPLEAVAEIAMLLRRTGHDVLVAGAALGLVLLGVLAQANAVQELTDPLAPIRLSLLALIVGGLLRGGTLLALTNSHLLRPVGMLRRLTGAPTRPEWSPVLVKAPEPARQELLRHVQLMVAAAYDRCHLAHGALQWALSCVVGFVLWTSLNVVSGVA
jgi:hypothetical protein